MNCRFTSLMDRDKGGKEAASMFSDQIGGDLTSNKGINLPGVRLDIPAFTDKNEKSAIRCVGLTIETRPDYGKLKQGNEMLRLGCTRVELGIQTIYDKILERIIEGGEKPEGG